MLVLSTRDNVIYTPSTFPALARPSNVIDDKRHRRQYLNNNTKLDIQNL